MKRMMICICLLLIVCVLQTTTVYSAQGEGAFVYEKIEPEEAEMLTELLNKNGFGGELVSLSILYDAEEKASFIIIVSKNGYLIAERENYRFCECGECNPYMGYENKKCFYGGPMNYFVCLEELDSGAKIYYDIIRKEESDHISYLLRQSEIKKDASMCYETREINQSPVYLPNYYNYIRRKAFGLNHDNTCSAVATGIALNYIALHENIRFVSNSHLHEYLDSGIYANAGQNYEDFISNAYSNAYSLHRYIADACGMGPASFDLLVYYPLNYYFSNAVKAYLSFPDEYNYNASAMCTWLPASETIRNNIIAGRPVLISTVTAGGSEYNYHTMCVYGHKTIDGVNELLVHTGWYSESTLSRIGSSNKYLHKIVWIDEDWAIWGYYFSYENPLSGYSDIPNCTDYTYNGILYCVREGYMLGTEPSLFSPTQTLDRAMAVQILYRIEGSPSIEGLEIHFTDVSPSSYYYNAVCWAYNNNVVAGTSQNEFSPHMAIKRQDLAVMLRSYATYKGINTNHLANINSIPDWSDVSGYAQTAVRWAIAEELLMPSNGTNGNYLPKANATRGQTAHAFYKFECLN